MSFLDKKNIQAQWTTLWSKCALLIIGLCCTFSVNGQQLDNTGETTTSVITANSNIAVAQQFTTGSSAYTDISVDVKVNWGSGSTFQVEIFDEASGQPNSSIATLTGNSSPSSGLNTYTGSVALSANTNYYIVCYTSSGGYDIEVTNSTTITTNDGFSTEQTTRQRSSMGVWSTVGGSQRFVFSLTASAANTLTVCASGCNHTTITAAITAASAGDIIEIQDAIHTENNITVTKNLTIQGQGQTTTTIQAAATQAAATDGIFTVSASVNATFKDFKLQNGNTTSGGGIYITSGSNVMIQNTTFYNNNASAAGGAVYIQSSSNMVEINNCVFNNNTASDGGAVYKNWNTSLLSLTKCTVNNNSANNSGGGIYTLSGTLTLINCTINGNSTQNSRGGGVYAENTNVSCYNNTVVNNTASTDGDGLYFKSSSNLTMVNNIVANNSTNDVVINSASSSSFMTNLVENCTGAACPTFTYTSDPLLNTANTCGEHTFFAPAAGSDALGNGTAPSGNIPTDDICGTSRTVYNLGSYEVQALSCNAPSAIVSSNLMTTSVNLSWTIGDAETAWNIEYGTTGFTQGTGTTVAANTNTNFGLTGLSANTAYDVYYQADCGSGNTSTWVGPYSFMTSPASNGLYFDGTNDYIACGNDVKFQIGTGTIEAWIKTSDAGSGWRGIISKRNAYGLYFNNNELYTYSWGTGVATATGQTLNDDTWHHVAMSFQTGVTNGTKIYVDGMLVSTVTYSISNQFSQLLIGESGAFNQFFTGNIDDVRIWNTVRTISDIQNNKDCELLGNETGLVAYYKLNAGTANGTNTGITTAEDATSNDLDGTLTNFALTGSTSNWVSGATPVNPAVSIVSDDVDNVIITDASVTFTATSTNNSSTPTYQWKKNGTNVGTNSTTYTDATLADGDVITCEMTNTNSCGNSITSISNEISMTVVNRSNGIHFDGSNDYIACGNDVKFQIGTGTIEAWIKTSNAGSGWRGIVSKRLAYGLYFNNNELHTYNWATSAQTATGQILNDDKWHHVAMSFQSGITNGTKIYVDGVLVTTLTYSINNHTNHFLIGESGAYNQYFTGNIDEVRIWNTARTASEIQNNKDCELIGNETGLVAYYKLNEGVANGTNTGVTTAEDATTNNLDGIVKNFNLTGSTSNWVSGATPVNPAVSIVSDDVDNSVIPGASVTFTATPTEHQSTPTYQWKKNGTNVGTNSTTYIDAALVDGDIITCKMTSNNSCGSSIVSISNEISMTVSCPFTAVIYVDAAASGNNDGTSWTDAYTDLQDAIDNVCNGAEIWVKAGTYVPTKDKTGVANTNDRDNTFYISKDGTAIYGGFAGTETMRSQRNITTNVTILSGDMDNDGDNIDNAYNVMYIDGTTTNGNITSATIIDGLTFTKGHSNGSSKRAGAIYNDGTSSGEASPMIHNCTFLDNIAQNNGGAIFNDGYNGTSNPTITTCVFKNNSSGFYGGAIYNSGFSGVSNSTITNCIFNNNMSFVGGAIANDASNSTTMNCTFYANTCTNSGGAVINFGTSTPSISNCIFWNNTNNGDATIVDADLTNSNGAVPTVTYSITQENSIYSSGTGIINNQNPLFVDAANDDFRLLAGSPALDAGTATGAPSTDFDGNPRPDGAGYDIGAYEGAICGIPSAMSASNITSTTADLSWTAGGSETAWNIEYGTTGFTQGTGTTVAANTNTNFGLTGLNPNTTYDVYYQADCGSGNTGDWVGSYSFSTLAPAITSNKAMFFDGTSEYINLSGSWGNVSELTVEAWVNNTGNTGDWQTIFGYDDGVSQFVSVQLNSIGNMYMVTNNGPRLLPITNITIGKWQHIALSIKSGDIKLYVNGTLVGTDGFTYSTITAPNSVAIGRGHANGRYFKGYIDEVRVWTEARSEMEIRKNMHHALAGNEANLYAYYPFDNVTTANGTANEIGDLTANGNHGTTVNMDVSNIINPSTAFVVNGTTQEKITGHQNASATINGVTIDDTNNPFDGTQDLFVTKVTDAPNGTGGIAESNIDNKYYLIHNFENGGAAGTFDVNLTMPTDAADNTSISLYRRGDGEIGNWSSVTTGTASGGFVTFTGLNTFSQYIMASNVALPVELLSFTAKAENKTVVLDWTTASEENNIGFDIERSTNGVDFEKIGFVEGNGTTSNISNYSFIDETPIIGTNYYRLKQLDNDGKFEYSKIEEATIQQSNNSTIKIYPNPVRDNLIIEEGQGIVTIYNMLGQPVLEMTNNKQQTTINVRDLTQGQYLLRITRADGTIVTQQFIK